VSGSQDIRERLKKISLFEAINSHPDYMEELVRICRTRVYKSGETIIREGELGDEMFIVLNGGVEILRRTRAIAKIIASRLRKTTVDMLTIFDALVSEIRGD